MRYVEDRRLVVDDGVATTTGITASMPMSLTLIEAIAGRDKARAVGRDIGLADWDARHDERRVQVHAAVRADGDRQYGRVLERMSSSASSSSLASTKYRWRWSRTHGRAPIGHGR